MLKYFHKTLTALSFFIPLIIYIITMAPTTSFWDCPEFISTSYILGVPHPPGSPLYLILGNFFSSIPFFNDIGARVNLISPITSALSVMFLYLIIVYLIEEYKGKPKNISDIFVIYFSAFIASLTFAVTDAHWFNAVEAEVYSISTFFTSIVVWMILKWSRYKYKDWNVKYLLIIIYMFGLATGLHLLNLLTLPFVALIIYFKKFKFHISSFLLTILLTALAFIVIYIGIIKGIPDITNKFSSLLFLIVFLLFILLSLILNHLVTTNSKLKSFTLFSSFLSIALLFFLIFNSILIKDSNQISLYKQNKLINTQDQIDKYDKQIFKLNSSVTQEQLYTDKTLQNNINQIINKRNDLVDDFRILYEDYFNFEKKKNKLSFFQLLTWNPKINLYIIAIFFLFSFYCFYYFRNSYSNEIQNLFKVLFSCILLILIGYSTYATIFIRAGQHPAINENNPDNIDRALSYMNRDQYGDWEILNWTSTISRPENSNWKRYTLDKNNPSKIEQIRFFINYQINEMYLRYFSWQFIGKGDKDKYPWYIYDLQGNLIGNQSLDGINWTRYGIPLAFIFGFFGILFHFSNDWKRALSVMSLFLATGIMIIIYLNQYDPQPRERDYSYVGSFFAFSIWIGIGLSSFLDIVRKYFKNTNISIFISTSIIILLFFLMPVKMFATDYSEHNRTGNYVAWDYGYNLLNSCEKNGIIFTNGDNDTFPLWYLQEVEGIRKDVKVVNLSLLNTPWYIEQLINQAPQLNLNFDYEDIKKNIYNLDPYIATEASFDICSQPYNDESWDKLDCSLNINNKKIDFTLYPTLIGKLLRVQDYLILEIIQDIGLSKPIYFAATVSDRNQIGLQNYLLMEGMAYKMQFDKLEHKINYQKMKQNLMQADLNKIIKTADDYNDVLHSGEGIYRYTNLNDTSIYYSDNIQRLVQNYRIGFIRIAEYELSQNDANKNNNAENFIEIMEEYFPNEKLPVEPGISILISDSIYSKTGNVKKQSEILKKLLMSSLPTETKIYLLHKFADLNNEEQTLEMAMYLIKHFSETLDFELQKYLGDILSDYTEKEKFVEFCDSVLTIYPMKGMLYPLVRVLEELEQRDIALSKVEKWLEKNPNDEAIIKLYDYLIEMKSIQ